MGLRVGASPTPTNSCGRVHVSFSPLFERISQLQTTRNYTGTRTLSFLWRKRSGKDESARSGGDACYREFFPRKQRSRGGQLAGSRPCCSYQRKRKAQ